MPFEKFDRSRLEIFPLEQRVHDVDISVVKSLDDPVRPFRTPSCPPSRATSWRPAGSTTRQC